MLFSEQSAFLQPEVKFVLCQCRKERDKILMNLIVSLAFHTILQLLAEGTALRTRKQQGRPKESWSRRKFKGPVS